MTVDPGRVPVRKLKGGALMPAIGLGTFGSDRYSAAEVATAVAGALEVGYRHFDCASVYDNEAEIGQVLEGFPRDQLWLTSKLWNDSHAPEDVKPACQKSLTDLRVDYLDAYLVHWPFPNHHAARCRRDVPQRPRPAIPPRGVHGHMAADGATG